MAEKIFSSLQEYRDFYCSDRNIVVICIQNSMEFRDRATLWAKLRKIVA